MTNQYQLAGDWNTRWHSSNSKFRFSVPVAYCPNPEETDPDYRERYVTTAYGAAFTRNEDGEDVAVVRLNDYGQSGLGRLDHLEVLEDIVEQILRMGKPDGDEAIQHNPECADCGVEMNWDEGFDCPVCHTHYGDNGQFSHRVCVEYECSNWGDLLGNDGQPRCVDCTVQVLSGEQTPFSPYECKRCKTHVVGIPARSQAAKNRLCGRDQAADDRHRFLDNILGRIR